MTPRIDLNCDLGESFGPWTLGRDEEVLAAVTSINVACGFHAGDPAVMRRTVRLAAARGVRVGAHPGLPDLQGFGRRAMDVTPGEVHALVLYQVGALYAFTRAEGIPLVHVKPHGALYNQAARDPALAAAVAQAVRSFDPALVLVGLSGSELLAAGHGAGLTCASEVCNSAEWPRSNDSMSDNSAIWRFSRSSAWSRRLNDTDRKACARTNTNRTKMMTMSKVDSAST